MPRLVDRDLDRLRRLATEMGALAEAILDKALRALDTGNVGLSEEVLHDDIAIDRIDVEIDDCVLELLATKAPLAHDLRFVLSTRAAATDIERVGDLARNIAKSAQRVANGSPDGAPAGTRTALAPGLEELAHQAKAVLRAALASYAEDDAAGAREVIAQDDELDRLEDEVIRGLIESAQTTPENSTAAVELILVAKNLERVGDHATNIAEDVILTAEALNLKHRDKLSAAQATDALPR